MRIGDHVAKRDSPEIEGQIVALKAGQARVFWSAQTSTWNALRELLPIPRKRFRKGHIR
jgi:hypothetical protein